MTTTIIEGIKIYANILLIISGTALIYVEKPTLSFRKLLASMPPEELMIPKTSHIKNTRSVATLTTYGKIHIFGICKNKQEIESMRTKYNITFLRATPELLMWMHTKFNAVRTYYRKNGIDKLEKSLISYVDISGNRLNIPTDPNILLTLKKKS